jgi:hypothetical protein
MGKLMLMGVPLLSVVFIIGSITASFYSSYLWVTQILLVISILPIMISMLLSSMTMDVSAPFFDAKMKHKTILFITRKNGSIVMKVPDSKKVTNMDLDGYGTFLDNPEARKVFSGLPAYQVYEDTGIPPQLDVIKICSRMKNAGINSLEDWRKEGNKEKIKYHDLDLKSVYEYHNNTGPTLINVRIERIAAELSAEYRQVWREILPWVSIMLVGLIFAAIAFTIIQSVSAPDGVPATLPSVPGSGLINP